MVMARIISFREDGLKCIILREYSIGYRSELFLGTIGNSFYHKSGIIVISKYLVAYLIVVRKDCVLEAE